MLTSRPLTPGRRKVMRRVLTTPVHSAGFWYRSPQGQPRSSDALGRKDESPKVGELPVCPGRVAIATVDTQAALRKRLAQVDVARWNSDFGIVNETTAYAGGIAFQITSMHISGYRKPENAISAR